MLKGWECAGKEYPIYLCYLFFLRFMAAAEDRMLTDLIGLSCLQVYQTRHFYGHTLQHMGHFRPKPNHS